MSALPTDETTAHKAIYGMPVGNLSPRYDFILTASLRYRSILPSREEEDTMRYQIHPIADENCSSLDTTNLLAATDDLADAERLADGHSNWPYGAGILDTHTGQIDVGAGFDDTEAKYEEQFEAAHELLADRIDAAADGNLDLLYQLICSISDALANEWQEDISTEEWVERAAKRVGI